MTTDTSKNDRIAGVLVGQACADALGMGYEFGLDPLTEGEQAVMRNGAMFPIGSFTDDTEQAIVVALAKADPTAVAHGLLDWLHTGPRDVGISTATVLGRSWNAEEVMRRSREYGTFQATKPRRPGFDPGLANGSLMRTGPVALAHLGNVFTLARAARQVSDVTHYDPTGFTGDACVIWSILISVAVHQGSKFDLQTACEEAVTEHIQQDRQAFWSEAIAWSMTRKPEGKNGSAVGAFKVAIWSIANSSTFEQAIQNAISCGHDTDTTAAITGMLAGALYGRHGIPEYYREIVHGKAGPYPGRMNEQDLADLALATAHGWDYHVPAKVHEAPERGYYRGHKS